MSDLLENTLFNLDGFPLFDTYDAFQNYQDWSLFYSIVKDFTSNKAQMSTSSIEEAYNNKDWVQIEKNVDMIGERALYLYAHRLHEACENFYKYYHSGQKELLDKLYKQVLRVNNATTDEVATWLHVNRHYEEQLN